MNARVDDTSEIARRLIIFTRYPEPGKTKTRLIPALGPHGAAALHRKLTERTLQAARELKGRCPVSIVVRFGGGDEHALKAWLGNDVTYEPQGDGDLGQRMYQAFLEAFEAGSRCVVLVGADIPGLKADILKKAFDALKSNEVVLGPAKDGGYYLMGLLEPILPLFQGLPWGGDSVLARTVEIAKRLGLQLTFVQALQDLDRVEDLHLLEDW